MRFIKSYQIFESGDWTQKVIPLEEFSANKYTKELINLVGEFKVTKGGKEIAFRNKDLFYDRRMVITYSASLNGKENWTQCWVSSSEFGPCTSEETLDEFLKLLLTIVMNKLIDDSIRYKYKEHLELQALIEENLDLFIGHGYTMNQIKFLIDNLKEIVSGKISPSLMSEIRKGYPNLWLELIKDLDQEGANTLADLGELGF
jgi:hypothetical protein